MGFQIRLRQDREIENKSNIVIQAKPWYALYGIRYVLTNTNAKPLLPLFLLTLISGKGSGKASGRSSGTASGTASGKASGKGIRPSEGTNSES